MGRGEVCPRGGAIVRLSLTRCPVGAVDSTDSLPFAAAGLLDYLRLALVRGIGGSPVDAATSQPSILICGVGAILALAISIRM